MFVGDEKLKQYSIYKWMYIYEDTMCHPLEWNTQMLVYEGIHLRKGKLKGNRGEEVSGWGRGCDRSERKNKTKTVVQNSVCFFMSDTDTSWPGSEVPLEAGTQLRVFKGCSSQLWAPRDERDTAHETSTSPSWFPSSPLPKSIMFTQVRLGRRFINQQESFHCHVTLRELQAINADGHAEHHAEGPAA